MQADVNAGFPYGLNDLAYWIIKRTDGTVIKHILEDARAPKYDPLFLGKGSYNAADNYSLVKTTPKKVISEWCKHDPISPVFSTDRVKLFIADSIGAKSYKARFDLIIDCGKVFTPWEATPSSTLAILTGDVDLIKDLEHHVIWTAPTPLRILKIDWSDRTAPDLDPGFWADLASKLEGDVMIDCQGGHGRSGTALTCLMMALNPEYSAKDAITHLRAIHCPRAIESVDQHLYLDRVALSLGRKADGEEINKVKDFRAAFLAMKHKSAREYQDKLRGVV